MDVKSPGFAIPLSRLEAFGDSLCLRDPRGRSVRPSLVREGSGGGPEHLAVRGSFSVLQRFVISPEEGRAFVETSRDANPIHTADSVVSGAMTAARLLLLPEVLVPRLAVKSVRLKFRAFSRYGRPTVNRYTFHPDARLDPSGGWSVELAVFQNGTLVADGTLKAAISAAGLENRPAVPCESADTIRTWLESLRMDPARAFAAMGYGYPRAFLASLPSGEMVRRGGAGGLLNVLDLEFPEAGIPVISPELPPTVEVEPSRPRNAFRRVLTKVASGMVTYCRGYATVLIAMLGGEQPRPARV